MDKRFFIASKGCPRRAKKWHDIRVGVGDNVRISSPSAWESSVYMF